jgi:DEAD/DEAH box helicase domain-containing protein
LSTRKVTPFLFPRDSGHIPGGLYRHQAIGIEKAIEGQDVCVATPTASGKSLIFIASAAHVAISHRGAKTLALYPAKALIQDQLGKWREMLDPLGLRLGFIDGNVLTSSRPAILEGCDVVLMTPDVTHAWLMSRTSDPTVRGFLDRLKLLILDEAHAYDGAFGTNMAYLLRRLDAAAGRFQVISSTATLGQPDEFIEQLSGRKPFALAAEDDGSGAAKKTLFLLQPSAARLFEQTAVLLSQLKLGPLGRFLVFGDSRKLVEHLVAATHRSRSASSEGSQGEGEGEMEDEEEEVVEGPRILPFRAGYEEDDRQTIQRALAAGELAGVVATSALELGIDIGDIQTVVLVGRPPSMNSFWQRLGRAGRRGEAVCLMLQEAGLRGEALQEYVRRPLEPNRLYLANRYIQYSHALCAATEAAADPARRTRIFSSLPPAFLKMLENELNPTEAVPADLYPLKQIAQTGPQYVFPLRR